MRVCVPRPRRGVQPRHSPVLGGACATTRSFRNDPAQVWKGVAGTVLGAALSPRSTCQALASAPRYRSRARCVLPSVQSFVCVQ